MKFSVSRISLRTRLLLMTTFAFLALMIAVLSAYRTARTSAYYAERRSAESVGAISREFSRGVKDAEIFSKNAKMPPPVREAFEKYADENQRRAAIALGAEREVSAGFCTTGGEITGAVYNQNFGTDESPYIQNICKDSSENNVRRYEFNDSILFIEAVKFDEAKNSISSAFVIRSVGKSGIFADRFNFLTQAFLLFSAIGLAIFSFLTLREWRGGMRKIETGLRKIPDDLSARINEPKIAELAFLSREINRLAENLEINLARQKSLEKDLAHSEKLAALGRMASGAAHEIRNPLAAMKLKIQLAERGKFDAEKLEKTFTVLREEIERLDNIVKKMLDASRPAKLNFSRIKIDALLKPRLTMIAEKAAAQSIEIKFDANDGVSEIEADAEKLTQVFDNLLNNALEAMPDGGFLTIKTLTENNKSVVEISDTGAGVSDAEKDKIFEPFHTTKDRGTGLGLAISREIIEAHNGRLFLLDTRKGAKFRLELAAI